MNGYPVHQTANSRQGKPIRTEMLSFKLNLLIDNIRVKITQ